MEDEASRPLRMPSVSAAPLLKPMLFQPQLRLMILERMSWMRVSYSCGEMEPFSFCARTCRASGWSAASLGNRALKKT